MLFGCYARAAGCVDADLYLRHVSFEQQGIRYYTDIGAQADQFQLDLFFCRKHGQVRGQADAAEGRLFIPMRIGQEGIMQGIITDEELAARWESENLGGYSWVFGPRYDMIPILQDIIKKADDVLDGKTQRVADLRFGHDTCLGPLTVLMGINGADKDKHTETDTQPWGTF